MLCKDCDRVLPFAAPLCDDGQDCGDLMCVICGAGSPCRDRLACIGARHGDRATAASPVALSA